MSSLSVGRTVVCQKWEERERGWGSRPDGYTLHLTEAHRRRFVQEQWDALPDVAPDEYSCPCGTPYTCQVTEEVYQELQQHGGSRWYRGPYPGSGGTDGWMQRSSTR
jgi:hypothetical protein